MLQEFTAKRSERQEQGILVSGRLSVEFQPQ